MGPKPGFDMRYCYTGLRRAKRAAQGAGRVPLDDDKLHATQRRIDASRHEPDVDVGIKLSRAAEFHRRKLGHAEVAGMEILVLTGEHQARTDAPLGERFG